MIKQYLATTGRLIFALWYFGVGVSGFALNDPVKDVANASTAFEKALAQTGFMSLSYWSDDAATMRSRSEERSLTAPGNA